MKNALVIGAGGFIGRHLCIALVEAGYSVIAADVLPPSAATGSTSGVTAITLDVTTVTDFRPLLNGVDVVFYLVCTLLPQASNEKPVFDIESNLVPVIRLLEAARSSGDVRVVFASSGGTVYGMSSEVPISETHPTEPRCSYGVVKLATEKYMSLYRELYGVPTVCLRISNPFGIGQDHSRPQGAVGVFLHKIQLGEPISIWGDGTVVRDYIFVTDVARAFVAAANYKGNFNIFNIGSGVGTSLNELLHLLFTATGNSIHIENLPARKFDVNKNVLSIDLARRELDWMPLYTLPKGIRIICSLIRKEEK